MIRLRTTPEDFVVDEVPLYTPSGEGEHTFVRIRKRGITTEEVARALADAAGVRSRDVGYAGRKDRVAIATQWFSVPGLAPALAESLATDAWSVREAVPHRHKLRTGDLRGNRFALVVRGDLPEHDELEARIGRVREDGLPNRFGVQRFGRAGDNAARGAAILRGDASAAPRDRRQRRFLLSALQSAVFNAVLDERPLELDRLEVGDVCVVHESGGLFPVEDVSVEQPRADRFEISATGPIFGGRMEQAGGAPGEREARVFTRFELDADGRGPVPRGVRMRGGRRALRIRPTDLASERLAPDAVRLSFELPRGSYATELVASLLGAPVDG